MYFSKKIEDILAIKIYHIYMQERIELIDTTLRDGQQSPLLFDSKKYLFSLDDKKKILEILIKLGVKYFELFSPIVSQKEKKDFAELRKFVDINFKDQNVKILAHCRCHIQDINQAIHEGADGLNLYIGTSPNAQKSNHGKNLDEIIELVVPIISSVKKLHPNLHLRFSGEDAFRTPTKDLFKVYDQVFKYVDLFGTPDTVGIAMPTDVEERMTALKKRYPKIELETHFHNDRGLAIINALTAIDAGAKYVDTSIWGLAERSGIPSTTSILFNMNIINKKLIEGYNLNLCYPVNVTMASILKMHVPFSEPVSLTNKTHSAGVHQQAVLKNKNVYEAHNLEFYGVDRSEILLGPLSGWHLIAYYLREIIGYELTDDEAKQITDEFKSMTSKISKRNQPEKLLLSIAEKYPISKVTLPKTIAKRRVENI